VSENIFTETVVIGAGLTGLSTAFHLKKAGKQVAILEKSDRTGGQIKTITKDGFVFETGPNTGTVSNPEVAELFATLEPNCNLEIANPAANSRLIWKGDRFHPLPSGLTGGIATPLFSFRDKIRILGEPFRKRGTDPDETVGNLAARRLGKSFVDYAVSPFISGIYAGDPYSLVTRYALPKLYNLEQNYGSFIKGSFAKAKEKKSERDKLASKKIFSAKGGLENLTRAMSDFVGNENIILSASSLKILPSDNRWKIEYSTPQGINTMFANNVVTTVGAYALPEILPFINQNELAPITNLKYAPVVQISVGVNSTEGLDFHAFGGLIPSCEKKNLLGILFPSACFADRAPQKGALFSCFIGGMNAQDLTELSETELANITVQAFHEMLKFPASKEPDMLHISRHKHAIPQYEKSTGERLQQIEILQNRHKGLIIAGNLRNGISMADRILQGTLIAKEIA